FAPKCWLSLYRNSGSVYSGIYILEAVERLLALGKVDPRSFSFSGLKASEKAKDGIKIIKVRKLQNPALSQYVVHRGISIELANHYLKEVTYESKGKSYFAVGFQNDLGGFELRSKYFKGGTSPKWLSVVPGEEPDHINLFEGFFDFLSCCQHHKVLRLPGSALVLNSLSLLHRALPILSRYRYINAFLDNDSAGAKAIASIKQQGMQVEDYSYLYASYKDYSDFLIAK
ncbi:toprim domain-containing protein, partial [Telluribacter humicola]